MQGSGAVVESRGPRGLHGRVTFDGPRPERSVLDTSSDPLCEEMHIDKPLLSEDRLVSEGGGVMNVFVWVKDALENIEYPVPSHPAVLDQVSCQYTPRVLGVRVGQTLDIKNSDPLLHNTRSLSKRNRSFNLGQPSDSVRRQSFSRPEAAIRLVCDVHPWMRAFVFSMDHPFFATTDEDGAFAIEGLPPGDYTLEAWHERYGSLETNIVVVEGSRTEANFTYMPQN